jgi:pSer/pThr/pTyr-binding forkhead associated (FHA) protein
MSLTLTVMVEGQRSRQIQLSGPEAQIGRLKGSTIRINANDVSRRHCRLRITPALVTVRDLGSSNGTYVNGKPITGERPLKPGDRLQVGRVQFLIEYQPSDEPIDVIPAEDDVLVGEEIVDTREVVVLDMDAQSDASSEMAHRPTVNQRPNGSNAKPAKPKSKGFDQLPMAQPDEPNPFADMNAPAVPTPRRRGRP